MRRLALMTAGVISLGGLAGLATTAPTLAAVRTVTHPPAVAVPDAGSTTATVDVANLPGRITDVDVALNNVFHTWPDDLDLFLRAPGSTQVVRLMSDVCGTGDLIAVNLTIDDEAGTSLPDDGACPSGSYRPSNVDTTEVAPAGTTLADSLSAFDGGTANGTWTLIAADDAGGDVGQLAGGFSLTITTDDAPGVTTITRRPRKNTRKRSATVGFTANKPNVTFQCKADDKAWVACTSPFKVKHLKPGKHKVRVRSVGENGQLEAVPALVKWRVRR
jgi:subtilisin-like proprotein convertase family protein